MLAKQTLSLLVVLMVVSCIEGALRREHFHNRLSSHNNEAKGNFYRLEVSENAQVGEGRQNKVMGSRPDSEPLYNSNELEFFGLVSLGTPSQSFKMIFDTEASGVWLPSSDCSVNDCGFMGRFDNPTSETYSSKNARCSFDVAFTAGSGHVGQDNLMFAGLNLKNQTFCEVTKLNILGNFPMAAEGVIGLNIDSSNSVIQNLLGQKQTLLGQKQTEESIFSLYLNRDPSVWPSGELTFGGIKEEHFKGDIKYVPLTNSSSWQIKVDGFRIGEDAVYDRNFQAVISTRTAYIVGPKSEIEDINESLGFEQVTFNQFGSLHCDLSEFPDFTFTIGGRNFTLKPEQYVLRLPEDLTGMACVSAFAIDGNYYGPPSTGPWVLGTTFTGSFYTVFDYGNKMIGLAELS